MNLTSTCPAALRSVGILPSVWFMVTPPGFDCRKLSLRFTSDKSSHFGFPRAGVSAWIVVTICTRRLMRKDLKEREGAGFILSALAHPLTMCTVHNTHALLHKTYFSSWECGPVCFQMFRFNGLDNVSVEEKCFQEKDSCSTHNFLSVLPNNCKWVQIHFCRMPFGQGDCNQ